MSTKAKRLECLDGLRGAAAMLVVLYHLSTGSERGYHPWTETLLWPIRNGLRGLPLLLMLSGLLLTHVYLQKSQKGQPFQYGSYLWGRWWRIGLPYYAALALYLSAPTLALILGLPSSTADVVSFRHVLTHLLFLHGFWSDTLMSISVPFWTLAPIFQFYLVFPLLFEAGRRWGWGWLVGFALASALLWKEIVTHERIGLGYLTLGVVFGTLPEFCFGMAVAFWYNNQRRAVATGPEPAGILFRAFGLALLFLGLGIGARALGYSFFISPCFAAGYAWLAVAVLRSAEGQGPLARLAGHRVLVWLGMISFSLYLTHSFVLIRSIQFYRRLVPELQLWADLLFLPLALALCLVFAWGFYQLVERRFAPSKPSPSRQELTAQADPSNLKARAPFPSPVVQAQQS